jgi:hypothetical protein
MKNSWLWFGCSLLLAAMPCLGADVGTITVLDGKPKLLRGTAWYSLAEGVRIRDNDAVELPDKSQLQLEFNDGGALSVIGPGAMFAASVTARDAKQPPSAELVITRGWLKLDTRPAATRIRIRTSLGSIVASDAAAVARVAPELLEVFVETGVARISEPGKSDGASGEVKAGGFATRMPGKPFASGGRPPSQFVGALPRDFMDPLPARAVRFASTRVEPSLDHEATYAEVQPWLSGHRAQASSSASSQARRSRLAPRQANSKANPEWTSVAKTKAEPAKEQEKEKGKGEGEGKEGTGADLALALGTQITIA